MAGAAAEVAGWVGAGRPTGCVLPTGWECEGSNRSLRVGSSGKAARCSRGLACACVLVSAWSVVLPLPAVGPKAVLVAWFTALRPLCFPLCFGLTSACWRGGLIAAAPEPACAPALAPAAAPPRAFARAGAPAPPAPARWRPPPLVPPPRLARLSPLPAAATGRPSGMPAEGCRAAAGRCPARGEGLDPNRPCRCCFSRNSVPAQHAVAEA